MVRKQKMQAEKIDCPRCQGPMVSEQFMDLLDDSGQFAVICWRCLVCGEVADPVILANRLNRPEPHTHRDGRRRPRIKVA